MKTSINDITTTLRIGKDKYEEFKEFAEEVNISLNSAFKIAASVGLNILQGNSKNVLYLDNPEQI